MELSFWQITGIVAGAVVAFGGIAWLSVLGLRRLLEREQGYPGEAEIEAALERWATYAIVGAFQLSERAMDEFQERLEGVDKKQIADTLYDLMPDTVYIGKWGIPVGVVKRFVTREQFAALVQSVFNEAVAGSERLFEFYKDQLGEFVQ